MKMTKWILTCALAVSMTAATIRAQKKDAPENTDRHSEEMDMLVDLAELDLLADMLGSFLREEEIDDSTSIADSQMPENGFYCIPGMDMGTPGGGFGMGSTGGFGVVPIMAGFNGMGGFGTGNGFSGYPIMGGFGGMGGYCGF